MDIKVSTVSTVRELGGENVVEEDLSGLVGLRESSVACRWAEGGCHSGSDFKSCRKFACEIFIVVEKWR
jgi:hypothetical protein